MLVADSGLASDGGASNLVVEFYRDIGVLNGLIFGTDGSVVDPVQWTRVATVPAGGTVRTDATLGKVFYMWVDTLTAVSPATLATTGVEIVTGLPPLDLPGYARPRLVRWGQDGFAYRTFADVVMFRSSLAIP
jgi:hypothetical protein